jgi:hypothetical protein
MSELRKGPASGGSAIPEKFEEKALRTSLTALAPLLKDRRADPMMAQLSLRTVLPTRTSRLLAAAIILLAITPFTAPFSAFDPAEMVSPHVHSSDAQLKVAKDATDFVLISTSPISLALVASLDGVPPSNRIDVHPVRVLVLRI